MKTCTYAIPHMIVFGYDDWHVLYKDGVKVCEGHQIRIYHLIVAAQGDPFTLEEPAVSEDWWYATIESGADHAPDNYSDIPQEAFA